FLLDELAAHLAREQRSGNELIFLGPKGGPLRRTLAARVFRPAVRAAGLDANLTFHGLRHVAASLLVEAGEHPRVIQQRLGHATARLVWSSMRMCRRPPIERLPLTLMASTSGGNVQSLW